MTPMTITHPLSHLVALVLEQQDKDDCHEDDQGDNDGH